MRKIKAVVAYKGTNFKGFQRQPNKRTVQGEIEKAIKLELGEETTLVGAGRTDAGVHACGQVISFDTNSKIKLYGIQKKLNLHLNNEISILSMEEVDSSFSARFSAKRKTYEYRFYISREINPILDEFALNVPTEVNIEKMNNACKYIVGKNDFVSFMSTGAIVKDTIRDIDNCHIEKIEDNYYKMVITGKSFLYNMVRIIMGVLLKIGDGKLEPVDMKKLIDAKSRVLTKTVSPRGLTLTKVEY